MAELATDGQAENVPWYSIRQDVQNITFSGNLTDLSTYAFYGMSAENVTIPDSVTSIGFGAFHNSNLTSVTIPNSVTYIGGRAFSDNTYLSSVVIEGTPTIGEDAFKDIASKAVLAKGNNIPKRIYTIEEAEEVIKEIGKDHVTFRIRYK